MGDPNPLTLNPQPHLRLTSYGTFRTEANRLMKDWPEIPVGVKLGLYWNYMGIMENNMETIILGFVDFIYHRGDSVPSNLLVCERGSFDFCKGLHEHC